MLGFRIYIFEDEGDGQEPYNRNAFGLKVLDLWLRGSVFIFALQYQSFQLFEVWVPSN